MAPSPTRQIIEAVDTTATNEVGGTNTIASMEHSCSNGERGGRCERCLEWTGRELLAQSKFVARMGAECIRCHQLSGDRPRESRFESPLHIDARQLVLFGRRLRGQFAPLQIDVCTLGVGLRADRHVFAGRHRKRTGDEPCHTGHENLVAGGV
jgi:hypothetical protein